LEDDLAEAESQLEAEKENARKAKRKFDSQLADLNAELARGAGNTAPAEEMRKLEDQVDELTIKLRAAEVARDEAEKDARQSALELADYKQQLEEADRKNAKLTNELRKLQADLDAAKEAASAAEDSRSALESTNRRMLGDVEDLKRKLSKETDGKVRAEDTRDALERDVKALKKEIELLERKNASAERDARELRAKLEDLRFQLGNEERAKSKLQDNSRDLRKLLLEREQQNKELIEKVHNTNDEDRRALDGEISSLKEKNDRQQEKVAKLQDDFEALFHKLEERKADTAT